MCQFIEFSRLPFNYNDSIYSTMFYSITGLHLLHVVIGTILLLFTLYKIIIIYNLMLMDAADVIFCAILQFSTLLC